MNRIHILIVFFWPWTKSQQTQSNVIGVKHTLYDDDVTENKQNWKTQLFPRCFRYYILHIFLDVSHVGVFNEGSEEAEEEGPEKPSTSELGGSLFWTHLSSLLWKKRVYLFILFQSASLGFFVNVKLASSPLRCSHPAHLNGFLSRRPVPSSLIRRRYKYTASRVFSILCRCKMYLTCDWSGRRRVDGPCDCGWHAARVEFWSSCDWCLQAGDVIEVL